MKAFMEWGEKCFKRFIGMFALIVIDLRNKTVTIARDHLGIKPIYFYLDEKHIFFASEIKCFRHFIKFEINENALYEQFFYRYVSGERTLFDKVYRLPAGSYMKFNKNGIIKTTQYCDVLDKLNENKNTLVNYKKLAEMLQNSIKMHTIIDVGYNIQLSGGLDSSYITAVLACELNKRLNTFSVELPGFIQDEGKFQKIVAGSYQTVAHSYPMGIDQLSELMPKATWHMDIPIVHTSCILLMELCKHSRKYSKVILTGEGADELLGGYGRYKISLKKKIAFQLQKLGLNSNHFPDHKRFNNARELFSKDIGIEELCNIPRDSASAYSNIDYNIDYRKKIGESFNDLLRKIIVSDQTNYLASVLERQDKMSMAMSVEARVPFCTYILFDYINSIQPYQKISPQPKIFLKKLSQKYFDNDFIFRKKNGFLLPTDEYLKDKNKFGKYLDLITDQTFKQRGYYNTNEIEKMIDSHLKENENHHKSLINLIEFEIWHRIFIDHQGNINL